LYTFSAFVIMSLDKFISKLLFGMNVHVNLCELG